MTLVTNGQWSVSCTTGYGIKGAILNVVRWPKGLSGKMMRGNCDGIHFASSDEAFQFAHEHGYLQVFVHPVCPHCRVVHTFLGHRSGYCDVTQSFV